MGGCCFRKRKTPAYRDTDAQDQAHEARCFPHPTRGHFVPEEEAVGGGGTDALISLPYNERQWPAELPIVLPDLQAVGGAGSP